jgi:excisionase family DNA binding protein
MAWKEAINTMNLTERKPLKEYPDVLEVKDLCAVLGISEKTAYGLLRQKLILHIRVGRIYKIPKKSVCKYLSSAGTP